MSKYRETLHAWAAQRVPEGAKITDVRLAYDDGWDPTFTDRPESLTAYIYYVASDGHHCMTDLEMQEMTSVGELLTALFAIEDDELDPRDLRNDTAWTGSTYGV